MHIFHGGNGRAVSVRVTSQPSSNHHRWSSFGGFRVSARLKSNSNFKGNTRRLSTGNRGLFLLLGKKGHVFSLGSVVLRNLDKGQRGMPVPLWQNPTLFAWTIFRRALFWENSPLFFKKRSFFQERTRDFSQSYLVDPASSHMLV